MKYLSVVLLFISAFQDLVSADEPQVLQTETLADGDVWVDPAITEFRGSRLRAAVWFQDQFLGDGEAYARRAKEFTGTGRRELRKLVQRTLRQLSTASRKVAGPSLDALLAAKKISNLEYHWIVNGFTCEVSGEHIEELKAVPQVRMIYFAGLPARVRGTPTSGQVEPLARHGEKFDPDQYETPWYIEALGADRVWKEHKVTGQGVLNVVHDGGFVLSPNIIVNRYQNPNELANEKDDSGNGLIDDLHGYDFVLNRPNLNRVGARTRYNARLLHGHQCVAIICGRGTERSPNRFGIAPESKWAGVLATQRIEAAVEWAIEQGADTYSMSFSIPNLREYRSHWRKLMEHGAFCGVHFVSGAGNFASPGRQFAPVPVQMRTPEDIPNVVFAAAGVKQDLSRTPFSSQGPVQWKTAHYTDGRVDKPEVCAFNFQLPLLMPNGKVTNRAASGNSFAGPMFCGAIALVLSANPDLNPWEVREIMIDTARDAGPKGYDFQTGHGLIDVHAAVTEALKRKR